MNEVNALSEGDDDPAVKIVKIIVVKWQFDLCFRVLC